MPGGFVTITGVVDGELFFMLAVQPDFFVSHPALSAQLARG
jgi:hypothetical protein